MKLTREGRRFILAAGLITVAAINTGNNLIYLILSLMLSFIVISYLLVRLNLADLSVDLSASGPIYAGEQVWVELVMQNRKRLPVYSVIVSSRETGEKVYCGHIAGHGVFRGRIKMVFGKRGLYGYGDFMIESGFPFILLRRSIPVHLSGQVLVYPGLLDLRDRIDLLEGVRQEGEVAVRGRGDEVYSLRAYQHGDDWRRIHWKASARQEGFLIREYAAYASQEITILLDNLLPRDMVNFEAAVSIAASLARLYIEMGYRVRLIAGGVMLPFGGGNEHLHLILRELALIAQQHEAPDMTGLETEGFSVAVLKSAESGLKSASAPADRVIYADSI